MDGTVFGELLGHSRGLTDYYILSFCEGQLFPKKSAGLNRALAVESLQISVTTQGQLSDKGKIRMRILHVANFNTRKYGADLYATDRKISAGLTRCGHFVYDFSYRDICRNESLFRTTRMGSGKLNLRLLEAVDNLRPELLLLGHSELIEVTTLEQIKELFPSIRIGLWYVDALFHRHKTAHLFDRLSTVDAVFATTGGDYLRELAGPTTRAAFIPNMVDPAVETGRSFTRQSHLYDFIFCGRDSNDPQRQSFMTGLQSHAGKKLRCGFRGCLGNPPLTGVNYLDFLQNSKMALNISRRNDVTLYSSDRLAQLVGNGLLTFCPRIPGMELLFAEDELAYFDDLEDLLEQLFIFQEDDDRRRKIAENGWQKAHASFTSQRVCSFMMETLFEQPYSSSYEWQEQVY